MIFRRAQPPIDQITPSTASTILRWLTGTGRDQTTEPTGDEP
jgi:hypothetical protein